MHCGHHHSRHGHYLGCHHNRGHVTIPFSTGPKYCHRHDWDQHESDPGFFETDLHRCWCKDSDEHDNDYTVGAGGAGKPAVAPPETKDTENDGDSVKDENSNRMAMPQAPTEPEFEGNASAVKEEINRLTKVVGKLVAKVNEMEMSSKKNAEEK